MDSSIYCSAFNPLDNSPSKPDEYLRAALQGETSKTDSAASSNNKDRPKRKYRSRARARSPGAIQKAKKVRRAKANDRERGRMHSLNQALEVLRHKLPCAEEEGKMTKIETLTLAHQYIQVLMESLTSESGSLCEPSVRLQTFWRELQASQAPAEAQQAPSIDTSFSSSGYSPSPPTSDQYGSESYGVPYDHSPTEMNSARWQYPQFAPCPSEMYVQQQFPAMPQNSHPHGYSVQMPSYEHSGFDHAFV